MFLNKINGPDFVHTNEAHFKKRSRELHFIEYISNTLTLLTRLGTIAQMGYKCPFGFILYIQMGYKVTVQKVGKFVW